MRWRDWQLGAALAAAPVFWAVCFWYSQSVFQPAWPLARPLLFAALVVAYPVLEEIVFRGLVQPAIAARLPGRWGLLSRANLLTSLLFAVLHLFFRPPGWALATFFPSLVFGYFRERHAGIGSPILLHIWFNLGYFLLFPPAAG